MITKIRVGLKEYGLAIPVSKLCKSSSRRYRRCSKDMYRLRAGKDCWMTLTLTCVLLAWHQSRSGNGRTDQRRSMPRLHFGTLGHMPASFLMRSNNGLVFTSLSFTVLVRGYGLRHESSRHTVRSKTACRACHPYLGRALHASAQF